MPDVTVTTRHSYVVMVTNSGIPTRKACPRERPQCPRIFLWHSRGGEQAEAEDREELREGEEEERFVVGEGSSRWVSHT